MRRSCSRLVAVVASALFGLVPGVRLREFEATDFEAAYRLDQACYPPEIAYSRFALLEFLRAPGSRAWVVEREDGLAGLVIVRHTGRHRGHVITLDVRADCRRQGIGRRLLAVAEDWLAEAKVRRVRLETAEENSAAVAFWRQAGYQVVGKLPDYYPGRRDALQMEKELA